MLQVMGRCYRWVDDSVPGVSMIISFFRDGVDSVLKGIKGSCKYDKGM